MNFFDSQLAKRNNKVQIYSKKRYKLQDKCLKKFRIRIELYFFIMYNYSRCGVFRIVKNPRSFL